MASQEEEMRMSTRFLDGICTGHRPKMRTSSGSPFRDGVQQRIVAGPRAAKKIKPSFSQALSYVPETVLYRHVPRLAALNEEQQESYHEFQDTHARK